MPSEHQSFDAERRFNLRPDAFPFPSHFLEMGGARLHYVDEGSGPVLFMLHGNPTWSFVFRHLIAALRDDFRCVAVDLAGFGLSDAPPGFAYRPEEHAVLIAGFLDELDLRAATLVAHDWGGPIGLWAMLHTPERITRLCLGNTWAWPVNGDFHFEWFSKFMGGPIGRFGSDRFALFVNGVMPAAMKRRALAPAEMRAYRAPFADGRSRRPMAVFPRCITASHVWLGELQTGLPAFSGPVHFIWPENDIAFRERELRRWLHIFPHASVDRLPRCGHYLWEDAPDDCLASLRGWLATHQSPTA
jgi:haloalkane dehalogenase